MALPVPKQGLSYIRWLASMSYINEALKKAQKEKDANSIRDIQSLDVSGKISRSLNKKNIYYTLIFIFIIIFILFSKSWFESLFNGNEVNTQKISQIEEKEMDQHFEDNISISENEAPKVDLAEIEESISNDKNQDDILFNKAVSLTKEDRIEEAKLVYRKVLSLNPGHIKALNDLGVLFLQEGKYKLAESYLEKAIRLNTDDVNPYYNLACVHALSGNNQKGMEYLTEAVELDKRVKDWIKGDTDLEGLKDLPEFIALSK